MRRLSMLALVVLSGVSAAARQADPVQVVAARAAAMAAADDFAGAVLVALRGKVVLRQAFGLADRERKIAVTPETKFRLGSMDKMFTAVAILQFVEAGKIGLDDPIAKYLPDYPNRDLAGRVTIRHLLTHTGGTGDIFPEYVQRKSELTQHSDFLKMFGARALLFAPGSEERYSNYGFIVLGAIIERVAGTSYYDHVAAKVFAAAGMRRTDSPAGVPPDRDRAVGYVKPGAAWVPNTDTLPARGTSAGGGYSTVDDLLRFADALQNGTLISKATFAMATTPHRERSPHGLGFLIGGSATAPAVGHSGGAPGMSGELRIFPATGHVFVALANQGPPGVASTLSRDFRLALAAADRPQHSADGDHAAEQDRDSTRRR
jgi:D-alanyl-D-alanine carboxypeptidase